MSLTIGIDVGGTKVLGGVVDESGKVLTTARKDTPRQGGSALTQTIADVAKELLQQHSVASVGVSAAGFVSSDRKTMLATPNIADWNGVDLDHQLTALIGLPVVIENDANAAAWGEAKFGAGKNQDHMMMLQLVLELVEALLLTVRSIAVHLESLQSLDTCALFLMDTSAVVVLEVALSSMHLEMLYFAMHAKQ